MGNKMTPELQDQLRQIGAAQCIETKKQQCLGDQEGGFTKDFWHYLTFDVPQHFDFDLFLEINLLLKNPDKTAYITRRNQLRDATLNNVMKYYLPEARNVWTDPPNDCKIILFNRIFSTLTKTFLGCWIVEVGGGIPLESPKKFTFVNSCCDQESCPINTLTNAILKSFEEVLMTEKREKADQSSQI